MGQEPVASQPSYTINQAVGLIVFLGGIVLLGLVFASGYQLYKSVDPGLFRVQHDQASPAVKGLPAGKTMPTGMVSANPATSTGATPQSLVLIVKLVVLVVMAWVGALITGKGIALATGPPRQAERA